MNEFWDLKSDCESFVLHCEHISLRVHTLAAMRRMYAYLQKYFREHPQDLEPPALGISVNDGIKTGESLK